MLKKPTRAPADLSPTSAKWWKDVVTQFDLRSAGELQTLTEAARSLDRIAQCREVLGRDGLFVEGSRGLVSHPACRLELQHRGVVLMACRSLGITAPSED